MIKEETRKDISVTFSFRDHYSRNLDYHTKPAKNLIPNKNNGGSEKKNKKPIYLTSQAFD